MGFGSYPCKAFREVWMDADLAAFAIRFVVEFVTLDQDLKRLVKDELQIK